MRSLSKTWSLGGEGIRSTLPCQERFAHPVVPRIKPFVALLGHAVSNACFMGNFFDQAAVDKFPVQLFGQAVGKLRSLAAIFPLNGDDLIMEVISRSMYAGPCRWRDASIGALNNPEV